MIASFSPTELDFTAAINSTGPIGDDLDLIDPIPLPVSFPQAVHSDPAPQETVMTAAVEPAAGPFQIRDLILFDVGFVSIFDPDVGRVIRFKALTFAGSQDGPGSIQITAGQVLLVRTHKWSNLWGIPGGNEDRRCHHPGRKRHGRWTAFPHDHADSDPGRA